MTATQSNVWRKRDDGLYELMSRDGSVSFIGGKRCLRTQAEMDAAYEAEVSAFEDAYEAHIEEMEPGNRAFATFDTCPGDFGAPGDDEPW